MMRATVRRETQYHIDHHRLQVVGEIGSVPYCNWMRRCVVDNTFHLAQPQIDGGPPDRRLAGHHQPHEGSKVRDT